MFPTLVKYEMFPLNKNVVFQNEGGIIKMPLHTTFIIKVNGTNMTFALFSVFITVRSSYLEIG